MSSRGEELRNDLTLNNFNDGGEFYCPSVCVLFVVDGTVLTFMCVSNGGSLFVYPCACMCWCDLYVFVCVLSFFSSSGGRRSAFEAEEKFIQWSSEETQRL